MTDFYWLILGILAVWRISYFLASETGPWMWWIGSGFAWEMDLGGSC